MNCGYDRIRVLMKGVLIAFLVVAGRGFVAALALVLGCHDGRMEFEMEVVE